MMRDIPSVCIMIPTYNQANYIIKAVESALAQDYPNKEIVIADDHSTDNTEEILKPVISNPIIKYTKNTSNLGRVANYKNCLYAHTTADWVINLDGDDYYTNSHFISQAIHAIQTSGLDQTLFYQGVNIIKSDTEEKIIVPNINSDEEWISSKDYFLKYFERNYFSHMSTLYNRQLAIKSNFYKNNVLSTDIFSFLSLCLNFDEKKVIVSKNISGVWLQHDNNISKTLHLKEHWDNFGLYIKLYKLAIENEYCKLQSFKWLMKACYNYLKGYISKSIEIFKAN